MKNIIKNKIDFLPDADIKFIFKYINKKYIED